MGGGCRVPCAKCRVPSAHQLWIKNNQLAFLDFGTWNLELETRNKITTNFRSSTTDSFFKLWNLAPGTRNKTPGKLYLVSKSS
jgi:hypothetical protein